MGVKHAVFVALLFSCIGVAQPTKVHNNILPGQLKAHVVVEYVFDHPVDTTVYWVGDKCPYAPYRHLPSAVEYKGKCYLGLMFDCHSIYVAQRERISESSFAHEMAHCIHMDRGGDGDADHSEFEMWAKVDYANMLLRQHGL